MFRNRLIFGNVAGRGREDVEKSFSGIAEKERTIWTPLNIYQYILHCRIFTNYTPVPRA